MPNRYRVMVTMYKITDFTDDEGEKIAHLGGTVEADTFRQALPGLMNHFDHLLIKMIEMADVVDADLAPDAQVIGTEVIYDDDPIDEGVDTGTPGPVGSDMKGERGHV